MRAPHVDERIEILDPSGPGDARRRAVTLAEERGADEETVGRVAIITTELAQNLVKYAVGGEILLRAAPGGSLEVLALDRGPGMRSPERALQDGFSTSGTRGTGLGGVLRLSTAFDLHSLPGVGSAIWASVALPAAQGAGGPTSKVDFGSVCRPVAGETACGDGWARACLSDGSTRLLLVDGLGHGEPAAEATRVALEIFSQSFEAEPAELVETIHRALRSTRGAALGLATLPPPGGTRMDFTGVGNVAGAVLPPDAPDKGRGLASHNGTAGYRAPRIATLDYPWPEGALLILHTDGLRSRYPLERYPGLMRRHPSVIAGILYRDFARGRDDVGVLVTREARTAEARP